MAYAFRNVQSGDCTIRVAVEGSGPLVLMVHGWPESWYSWRHQMKPVADAGYTAAAMDVRGYGGSSRPHPIEAYDMQSIVKDVQAVADALGGGKAILIGHDWGAPIVWNSALIDPERFTAVAAMAIPYMGQGKAPFIDIARKLFTENGHFFYQIYIQDEGVAEAELEADVRGGLRKIYYSISGDAAPGTWPYDKKHGDSLLYRLTDPEKFPAWLSDEDIDYYVKEFEGSGFRGPFNRYRNFHRDFAYLAKFADRKIEQPALFISGKEDMALRMFGRDVEERMREHVPNLRGYHLIERCGHWTQQEKPAEVNALLLDWLKGL
ncbi:MAG TPA: alpha/beta hydrolase [Hyphomonadaceae bacterium]|nr:alpha/beta hydrolase [Hyphomonadaceae bacterium]